MPLIKLPKNLAEKLGPEGSDEFIQVINEAEKNNRDRTFELLEERFSRKLLETENRLEEKMNRGFVEVQKQFVEVQKQFVEVQKQFGYLQNRIDIEFKSVREEMHQGFLENQRQFVEIQKQINRQTKWMFGLIGSLAVILKLLDLIFK